MKNIRIPFLILILIFSAVIFFTRGNTMGAEIDLGQSEIYSQEDIESAARTVKRYFASMKGCRLYSLSYAGDDTARENLQYCNTLGDRNYDECIVFKSRFRSPIRGGEAWEANAEYYWSWSLARQKGGEWVLLSWGY